MRRSFHISKRRLVACAVAVLLVATLIFGLYGLKLWEESDSQPSSEHQETPVTEQASIYVDGQKYVVNEAVESILFLGIDSYEKSPEDSYINGQQADMLMLLVMDHANKSYSLVQINRDTMASFQTLGVMGDNGGTTTAQIALSHAYGTGSNDSSRNTTKAVSNLFYGVSIPHFATLHMKAIATLNDEVGGVTLELMDDFTMLDESFTKGSTVTLNGEQATAYVQYRGQLQDSTNISRMARQKQYMSAWLDEFEQSMTENDSFMSSLALKVSDNLISDLTVEQMNKLSQNIFQYTSNGIVEIAGESVKGETYMEFHVDEEALQKLVLDLFYTPAT